MPHKSRKAHNWLTIIGGAFAFLLIVSSLLITSNELSKTSPIRTNPSRQKDQGIVAGASQEILNSPTASVDVSSWKDYKDPIYHFKIKYPSEWADPVAEKINDPDFAYEYQVSFGTEETIAGSGVEGFTVYVFPTDKCAMGSNGNQPKCATTKSTTSAKSDSQQKIFEFSSKIYTYTIVPFVPASDADPNLIQKINLEIDEAQKTFTLDPNLQLIPKPQKQTDISIQAPVQAPTKKPAASKTGKAGKLTGAVSSGGKLVCPHPNRKPMRSPNKGNHVDEDCCPDPDEYPNAACAYKPSDYAIMLKP